MKRNANILVTHDFSERSNDVLDYGIEFAIENQAALHFLHIEVMHDDTKLSGEADKTKAQILREKLKADIHKSLEKQGYRYDELHSIKYTVLRDIAAAPAIITYCKNYEIDLVVMGTHGRRGVSRKLLGSVAEEVVRLAPCTVFTLREQVGFRSLDEQLSVIAVPFDFSDHSREALVYAREMAASFGASLDVVHVIEEKLHPAFYQTGIASVYDLQPDIEGMAVAELKNIFERTPGPEVETTFTILHGHPVKEIIKWTETQKHDLIVIATHGLSGIDRALLGSVTERIVRLSPCPVMTVKAKEQLKQSHSTFTENIGTPMV